MTIATGINKRVAYGLEPSFGEKSTEAGQLIRRVSSTLALTKDTYESKEIRPDFQVADMRHGVRRVAGDVKGELAPGSYTPLIGAALRNAFGTTASIDENVIGADVDGFTRTSGNFTVGPAFDNFAVGDVVRATGFAAASNNNRNFLITAITPLKMTGRFLDGTAVVPEAAGAHVYLQVVGGKAIAPLTGHSNDSFTFEHFHEDLSQTEIFKGCKVNGIDISLPPTGMAEISIKLMGQDMEPKVGEYFFNPAPASANGVLSAVNGLVFALGKRQTVLTNLSLSISGNLSGDPVVGSNVIPELFNGRIKVSGSMSAYFDTVELRDAFLNESEVSIFAVFTSSNAPDADFVSFTLPRVKLGGSSKDDGEKGLIQTVPFTALLGTGANGFDKTTICIQDSTAA